MLWFVRKRVVGGRVSASAYVSVLSVILFLDGSCIELKCCILVDELE